MFIIKFVCLLTFLCFINFIIFSCIIGNVIDEISIHHSIICIPYTVQGISEQPRTIIVKITPWVGTKIGLFARPPHLGAILR